jgi:hypothetical protein
MQPIRRALQLTFARVATYVYRGTGVPKPGDDRPEPNLWRNGGAGPSDRQPVGFVVESLMFAP